jgi:hypothetical protein
MADILFDLRSQTDSYTFREIRITYVPYRTSIIKGMKLLQQTSVHFVLTCIRCKIQQWIAQLSSALRSDANYGQSDDASGCLPVAMFVQLLSFCIKTTFSQDFKNAVQEVGHVQQCIRHHRCSRL